MLPITFPELFPTADNQQSIDDMFAESANTKKVRLAMGLVRTILGMAQQPFVGRDWSLFCDSAGKCMNARKWPSRGLVAVLALETPHLRAALTAYYQSHGVDECSLTCSQTACGIQEIRLSGKFGMTVGASAVGFCSPDTNPFQFSIGWDWVIERDLKANCALKYQKTERTVQLTLAVGIYLQVDIARFIDDNNMLKIGAPNQFRLRLRVPVVEQSGDIFKDETYTDESSAQTLKKFLEWIGTDVPASDKSVSEKANENLDKWASKTFKPLFEKVANLDNTLKNAKILSPFAKALNGNAGENVVKVSF